MKSDKKREYFKESQISLTATIISALITAWTGFGQMLGLQIAISRPYNWAAFAVFGISTAIFFAKYMKMVNFTSRDNGADTATGEDGRNGPEFKAENRENLNKYLNADEKRSRRSDIIIESGSFEVKLLESDQHDLFPRPDVMQEITWTYIGRVVSSDRLRNLSLLISTSALTSWDEDKLLISAFLKKVGSVTSEKDTVHFDNNNISRIPINGVSDVRLVEFTLPRSVDYQKGDTFEFKMCMKWEAGYRLCDVDSYFTDPQNLGLNKYGFEIIILTDSEAVFDRNYTLFEVSRVNRNSAKAETKLEIDHLNKIIRWNIRKCDPQKIYVVQIVKKSE